ncbi:leucyl/phenylalanyl-tRNA--protein transferase [Methylovulum psychrotolerans]|uniref:Leucyl/phenylalanyl-tRNA--protein transferase n=1 Tax=Methylovulum psychrotolerans TaxID=1704499 RepID=A0A1Z4BWE8_9GAMM|nr:leucyl/phenylalanyl-tRNA--protein transferase [Methylovulum psychrotolerans]ASF45608.1 leucyl/phenylalanyl-tRNA--protein transferase [Methylovulum psychrotolerans]MBT9098126.1 leucyl/phenylalanyl-tRNA--protein transferase [Methylovulum psychrotolerans]POZ53827.1 leucyl/phenylalanyl-tRNA--protein transferase [Methylovulum psychrotolerans]
MKLTILNPKNPEQAFPSVKKALKEPDGLLAIGGCLSKKRLLNAYRQGIFPWYNPGEPILWWSPDPRLVLFPDKLVISRSLRKTLRQNVYTVTIDRAFAQVMDCCAQPRAGQSGTWITVDIKQAYNELFRLGIAHSVEAWLDGELVGGLYGVALGQVFFGESMFHTRTDASKVAFAVLVGHLKSWQYRLIDCQVHSQHLVSLGAEEISRDDFVQWLGRYCDGVASPSAWSAV